MVFKKEKVEDIKPLSDGLVIEVLIPKELKTDSGLVLKTNKDADKYFDGIETYHGKIRSIGSDVKTSLKVGSCVVFDRLAGHGIPTEGDAYIKIIPYKSLIMRQGQDESINTADPLHERVIVKLDKPKEKTDGGIYTGATKSASNIDADTVPGTVVSVAEEVKQVKKGDRVWVDAYAGISYEEKENEYKVLSKYDLIAVI